MRQYDECQRSHWRTLQVRSAQLCACWARCLAPCEESCCSTNLDHLVRRAAWSKLWCPTQTNCIRSCVCLLNAKCFFFIIILFSSNYVCVKLWLTLNEMAGLRPDWSACWKGAEAPRCSCNCFYYNPGSSQGQKCFFLVSNRVWDRKSVV